MKTRLQSVCVIATLLVAFVAPATRTWARPEKTEDELIQDLSAANGKDVARTMMEIEKRFPQSPKALPLIKAGLKDPRSEVRRKAARVLGVWHSELNAAELQDVTAMLKAAEREEVQDALKGLGGMRAKAAVPQIVECLKHENSFVVRDACRALAAIGDKSVIPAIEPLTQSADEKIKKDAEDAIFKLK